MKALVLILFMLLSFSAYAEVEKLKCSAEVFQNIMVIDPEKLPDLLSECGIQKSDEPPFEKHNLFSRMLFSQETGVEKNAPVNDNKSSDSKIKCELRQSCQILELPISTEYTDFLFTFSNYVQKLTVTEEVPDDCSCLHEQVKSFHGSNLDTELKKERERTNKIILEALSKKFLNDFSSNMEDASFFLLKTGDVFTDSERAKEIQCIDSESFNREIAKRCHEKGITDESFISQRKDILLNTFGNNKLPLEQKLSFMANEIQTISYSGRSGQEISLTRAQFDNARMGLAHRHPSGKAADEIIKKLLKHSGIMAEMEKNPRETPIQVTLKYLESQKDDPTFVKSLGLSKDSEEIVKNATSLKETFRFLMNTHPGFLSIMGNQQTFKSLYEESKRSPELSTLEMLETKSAVLEPHLLNKCKNIRENFAKAVCTSDEELVAITSTQDLDLLMNNYNSQDDEDSDPLLRELLVCKERAKGNEPSVRNLAALYDSRLPSRKSDYLERVLVSDIRQHKNLFSRSLLLGTDAIFREGLEQAAEYGQRISKPVSQVGVVAAAAEARAVVEGKKLAFGNHRMTKTEATKFLNEHTKYEKMKYGSSVASTDSTPVTQNVSQEISAPKHTEIAPSFIQPQNNQIAPVYSNIPAKEQLTRHLSKKYEPEKVKKAVESLDEKNLEDLNKLRTSDNQAVVDSIREETKKLQDFQSKIKELEGKLLDSKNPVKEATREIASTESTSESVSVPEISSAPKAAPVVSGAKSSSTSSDAPVSASSVSEPVKPGPEKVLKADNYTEGLTVEPVSKDEKLVQEVRKYFENPELPESSFEEIKTRGIRLIVDGKEVLVKFDSLDENTKHFIELKLAQKKRDTQIAKLSVLKMLMKN